MHQPAWLSAPEEHDYPAALDYLDLLLVDEHSTFLVDLLRDAPVVVKKAKDILRASELPLLDKSESHVAKDLAKVKGGIPLSPVLLVRFNPLVIADGYHRVCALYHLDPDTEVHCKLV